jgi:hypothetical protein
VFDRTGAWAGITVEVVGQEALVVSAVDVFARLTARRDPELLQSYERQLLLAAAAQHADRIQALCAAGARMVSVGDAGSALHVAAWKGDPAAVRALRKCANFDVEIRSSDASTPLMLAARYGHKDLLDLLLSWRADARAKTASGSTALHQAAEGTGNEAVRPAIVQTLVQSGADPNAPSDGGWTPLLSAISAERHGPARTGIVKELLDVGADPNRHATLGSGTVMIPLHLAVEDGVSATVEALLAKHARVDALDTQGRTALMKLASDRGVVSAMQTREGDFSCWNDDDDLTLKARVLLKYRADTSLRDREHGKTALELGKSRHVSTPGDKRCRDCMIAALRGARCRDTWED